MNEEKNNNNEEIEVPVQDENTTEESVTEGATGGTEESVSEENVFLNNAESQTEDTEVTKSDEDSATETENIDEDENDRKSKKVFPKKVILIGVVVAILIVIVFVILSNINKSNPYEKDYVDTTGRTIGQAAEESGMDYEQYLEKYGLPSDMPKTTSENAAVNAIPLKKYAELCGMETQKLKELLGVSSHEEFTDETPIGDVLAQVKVVDYVGESQFDAFKETYELGDDVTRDTLWGDIRNRVYEKNKEAREAEEKLSSEAPSETIAPQVSPATDSETMSPSKNETADDVPIVSSPKKNSPTVTDKATDEE